MPLPAAAGAAFQGASNLSNKASNLFGNAMNFAYNEYDYRRKRKHSLQDWNRVNAYNHPSAQRSRLEAAGLNPALMYGGSSGAASGAASAAPRSSESKPFQFSQSPSMPILDSYYDSQLKQAQIDNLQVDKTIKIQDALLRTAQADTAFFDLGLKRDLRSTSMDAAREGLRKLKSEIDLTQSNTDNVKSRTRTQDVMRAPNFYAAVQNLLRGAVGYKIDKKRLKKIGVENEILRIQRDLNREGIFKSDPMYLRMAVLKKDEILKKLDNWKPSWKRDTYNRSRRNEERIIPYGPKY